MTQYKRDIESSGSSLTEEEIAREIESLNTLVNAVMFNHDVKNENFKISVTNPQREIPNYKIGMTQMTLPHRFGYKRELMRMPKQRKIAIQNPEDSPIESDESDLSLQETKVRKIFN